MSRETDLAAAKKALHDLLIGKRVVSVQKDGRKVDYTSASLSELRNYIETLEVNSRRRPPARVIL